MSTQNPLSVPIQYLSAHILTPSQLILPTPSIFDYPSALDRQLAEARSQLNLAILSKLPDIVRAIFPFATQHNRQIYSDLITVYLDYGIDPSFPGEVVNPGYWIRQSHGYWGPSSEIGTSLISLYAKTENIPDFFAEHALRAALDLPAVGVALPKEKLRGWVWETRPLSMPRQNPLFTDAFPMMRAYLGKTSRPVLWAVQTSSCLGPQIHYLALMRRNDDSAAHWVEALPPGELPLFGSFFSLTGGPLTVRIVPSEFDPRFQKFGSSEIYCAVPGGAASLPRTDLSALAGHRVHLELLPDELAYTPGIFDALGQSNAADVMVSLIGEPGAFPLNQLREVAGRHGHSFPLPALPEPMMPDNSLITEGSPLPPSENPRRFLLEPVIPEGGLVWLYAREKVGKTWLALAIADAVSRGGSIGPWKAKEAAKTVYIDGEMHPDDLDTAIAKVTRGQGNGVSICFDAICAKKTKRGVINLAEPAWREEIKRRAKGKSLLILDNFYSLTNNNVGEFPEILDFLQELRAQGIAVVVIDHTNREGGLQGAHTKERAAETVIEMRIPEGRSWRENIRAVEVTKARHYIPEPADYFLGEMVFTKESFRFDVETLEIPAGPEPIPAEIAKLAPIMIAHDIDRLSFPKIQERLGTPRSTASDWHKKAKKLSGADREALDREIQRLLDARKAAE